MTNDWSETIKQQIIQQVEKNLEEKIKFIDGYRAEAVSSEGAMQSRHDHAKEDASKLANATQEAYENINRDLEQIREYQFPKGIPANIISSGCIFYAKVEAGGEIFNEYYMILPFSATVKTQINIKEIGEIFSVSEESPLDKELIGKKIDETAIVGQAEAKYTILEIYV